MIAAARAVMDWGRDLPATVTVAGVLGESQRWQVELLGERVELVRDGSAQALTASDVGPSRRLLGIGNLSYKATRRALARMGYG